MLVENKSDLNKNKVKVQERVISRQTYSKYNILDKKVLSAKHQRGKINTMILELLRRIHENKEVKARNRKEQFIPDEDYVKKKKRRYGPDRGCCGGYTEEEVTFNK